jgi:hypothetical protein
MNTILIGEHAYDRMRQRKVARMDVESAIRKPDRLKKERGGRRRVIKKLNGRSLIAFYTEIPRIIFLVSAFWRKA